MYNSHPGEAIKNFMLKFNNISTVIHRIKAAEYIRARSVITSEHNGQGRLTIKPSHKCPTEAHAYTKPKDNKTLHEVS